MLTTALVSNRDADWSDPVQAAAKAVANLSATGAIEELDSRHRGWWARFWSKSHVQIETDRPAFDSGLHRFYYGALHVLASASRSGKVRRRLFFAPFCTKNDHFYQDRLGTDIRKTTLKKRSMRFCEGCAGALWPVGDLRPYALGR